MSYECAKEIARSGFSPRDQVRVAEHLSEEQARTPDASHAVVVLAAPWDFRLKGYPRDSFTEEHLVPAHVLNLFERAVWSV
jgi:hypothetical protein